MKPIANILKDNVPDELLSRWINQLKYAYSEAESISNNNFEKPESSNLLPYLFNSKADELLRRIAQDFPQIRVKVKKNDNNYQFTLLEFNDIILTQKAIASPGEMVKASEFRRALAIGNSVYCDDYIPPLFVDFPLFDDINGEKIYGILTHNRSSAYKKNGFAFANIAFPDPTFKSYLFNIDLHEYCGAITDQQVVDGITEIDDEITPKLKIKRIRENNA